MCTEKPLDNIITDGGLCSIFRIIGCVGDSLSSGEFEVIEQDGVRHYYDMFEYSWGQFMARATGAKVYNFSRGGMTASEYMKSFAESKGFWDQEKACQAYILALGVNDMGRPNVNVGTTEDIDMENWENNADSFAGHYGAIIQRLKKIQPDAKFFLMTMPSSSTLTEARREPYRKHGELLRKLPSVFSNTYVLDFEKYAPDYGEEFHEKYFLNGHMSPAGYMLTSRYVLSYIDYIIRHNPEDFKMVGFVGSIPRDKIQ